MLSIYNLKQEQGAGQEPLGVQGTCLQPPSYTAP